jgi:glutamate transport system permease protein
VSDLILADELGPLGRRRVRVVGAFAYIAAAAFALAVIVRFNAKEQLLWKKWDFITDQKLMRFLLRGLRDTITAALVAMVIAVVLGAVGAYARLHPRRPVRAVAIAVIELLRATPLVLLIYFMGQFVPRYGPELGSYWYLVIGLAAYNSSVIAEVFRSGVNSLPAGQREAGLTIGFTEGEVLRRILFPQGVRRMVPALVNQLVTLLKDSSLGALVLLPAVNDLLHQGKVLGEFKKNPLQVYIVVALLYVLTNLALSQFARYLERRRTF